MAIQNFKPTKGKIFVTDLDDGMHITKGGIILTDDKWTEAGIRPRWARVAFLGEGVDYVDIGEWVLIQHGRWTIGMDFDLNGETKKVWMIDPEAILVASNEDHSLAQITF